MSRCQSITKNGIQCSRKTFLGGRYCWQHESTLVKWIKSLSLFSILVLLIGLAADLIGIFSFLATRVSNVPASTAVTATPTATQSAEATKITQMGTDSPIPTLMSPIPTPVNPDLILSGLSVVLEEIENADGDGNYTVAWRVIGPASVTRSLYYVLEEASNSSFLSAKQIYTGTAPSLIIADVGPTRYYYRVRAVVDQIESPWSARRWVDVRQEKEPNSYINLHIANGPLIPDVKYYGWLDENQDWDCFKIRPSMSGHLSINLQIADSYSHGVQLLLYYGTDTSRGFIGYVTELPYDINYDFAEFVEGYFICLYARWAYDNNPQGSYTLAVTYPYNPDQ